jgi:ATP-binding cassette subfamily F protein 3
VSDSERQLERLAVERADIERSLQAPELYEPAQRGRLSELLARQATIAAQTTAVEAAWLEAHERLERLAVR